MEQDYTNIWGSLIRSIHSHRAHRARFYKPVCVIAAIDIADEASVPSGILDAHMLEHRFRRYVGVLYPKRIDQAWRPIWHVSIDGLWQFFDDERLIEPDDFGPDRKPSGRTQFFNSFDRMEITYRYGDAWSSAALRGELRSAMLSMLANDDETSRPFARQLADPKNAFNPGAWPAEDDIADTYGLAKNAPDLFGFDGVEGDGGDRDDGIREPFDPETIQMETRAVTVDLLLHRASTNRIDLQPDFQRRSGIWDERRQSRLIESMLLRIPLPVIYAAEDDEERWEIVDGIQRLTTIARFIRPDVIGAPLLRLSNLEYLKEYEGATFEDLSERMKLRLRETELGVNIIKKQTPPEVKYNIFARINSGGVVLRPQELRHAITPGPVRRLLEELATSDAFVKATDSSISPQRMADRELVLRFLAFRVLGIAEYRNGDMDGFLLRAMRAINHLAPADLDFISQEFIRAMESATRIFGNDAFRKRSSPEDWRHPINKGLFEAVGVNLAHLDPKQIDWLEIDRERVREGLMALCADPDFDAAITQGTADVRKVTRRFSDVGKLFAEIWNDY